MTDINQTMTADDLLSALAFSPNPTAIYKGEDLIVELANDAMLKLWGKEARVVGKPLEEALPELEGQPFAEILRNVWRTGETYTAVNMPVTLHVDSRLQIFFFDFEYKAVKRADGSVL